MFNFLNLFQGLQPLPTPTPNFGLFGFFNFGLGASNPAPFGASPGFGGIFGLFNGFFNFNFQTPAAQPAFNFFNLFGSFNPFNPFQAFQPTTPAPPAPGPVIPAIPLFDFEARSLDGTGNNMFHPEWGSTLEEFTRRNLEGVDYDDGIGTPVTNRPNPREISNEIFDQPSSIPNSLGASDLFWVFGQFIDHELTFAEEAKVEAFNIPVIGDPDFFQMNSGNGELPFFRNAFEGGTDANHPRQQINTITSFIDGSAVYGQDAARANFIKDALTGKLVTIDGELPPLNTTGLPNAGTGGDSTLLHIVGDVRGNENPALLGIHTLWVREHNYLVDKLNQEFPNQLSPDELYETARALVAAEIQVVTYNEFLPLLLGDDAIPDYTGYHETVDPNISNVFATAAYRIGHTLLSSEVEVKNEDGTEADIGHLALQDIFFRTDIFSSELIDDIFRGITSSPAEELDVNVIDDVRNFLFQIPNQGGATVQLDLVAVNIQRGLDHGLADYNTLREAYNLDPVNDFSDITSDVNLQMALASLYGDVDHIDAFVGGLAEDPLPGAMVGELFHAILVDDFTRIREGDRLWHEEQLPPELLPWVQDVLLSDIILRNTDIDYLQDLALVNYNRITDVSDTNVVVGTWDRDLIIGFDGNDMLTGGAERDIFAFRPGDGVDTITDFTNNEDAIDLRAFNVSFDDLTIIQSGNDVNISNFGISGETIILQHIDIANISPDDFLF